MSSAVRVRPAVGPTSAWLDVGLVCAVLASAGFASSGPFGKALLATGWTPGAVVLVRVAIAGLVLLGPAL